MRAKWLIPLYFIKQSFHYIFDILLFNYEIENLIASSYLGDSHSKLCIHCISSRPLWPFMFQNAALSSLDPSISKIPGRRALFFSPLNLTSGLGKKVDKLKDLCLPWIKKGSNWCLKWNDLNGYAWHYNHVFNSSYNIWFSGPKLKFQMEDFIFTGKHLTNEGNSKVPEV